MQYLSNAHTHLELTALNRLCPKTPMPFFTWLHARVLPELFFRRVKKKQKIRKMQEGIIEGIRQLKACGTTHVCDITATGLSVAPLMQSGLSGIVFLEVLGNHLDRAIPRLEKVTAQIASLKHKEGRMRVGLSLHAPYTCHSKLLQQGARWCKENKIPLCIHVSESAAEVAWLASGKAPRVPWINKAMLRFFFKEKPFIPPYMRPIPYLHSLGVLDAEPFLIHAVHVTNEEISLIRDSGSRVVNCPRSNYLLANGRMPLKAFLDAGVEVYMGTDSLTSSPDLDIRQEAAFAATLHKDAVNHLVIEQLISRPIK